MSIELHWILDAFDLGSGVISSCLGDARDFKDVIIFLRVVCEGDFIRRNCRVTTILFLCNYRIIPKIKFLTTTQNTMTVHFVPLLTALRQVPFFDKAKDLYLFIGLQTVNLFRSNDKTIELCVKNFAQTESLHFIDHIDTQIYRYTQQRIRLRERSTPVRHALINDVHRTIVCAHLVLNCSSSSGPRARALPFLLLLPHFSFWVNAKERSRK